ncbi:MAG: Holliday junction resolvase RuvX [Candidatus Paraimprobicoccus trichonymphae]|uniref:Putative pre-16S rRNA nuclease n=1 Tax=Candidatus Paraimprobicoccus trichonymphae TaxID=3033793 RepID=A0AA48I592_9FIRM|nr:MAG: Holliday junction resolvase RuvX [Candidatus Paraimprobicoccus trichonymphae]
MIILSIDFGTSRTGLAMCDNQELLAYPLRTIFEKNELTLSIKISKIISKNSVDLIVVGLPKNMNGSIGKSVNKILEFSEILKKFTDKKIIFWDERNTTNLALHYLNKTNTRNKKRKKILDTVVAVIILEEYLRFKNKDNL